MDNGNRSFNFSHLFNSLEILGKTTFQVLKKSLVGEGGGFSPYMKLYMSKFACSLQLSDSNRWVLLTDLGETKTWHADHGTVHS